MAAGVLGVRNYQENLTLQFGKRLYCIIVFVLLEGWIFQMKVVHLNPRLVFE